MSVAVKLNANAHPVPLPQPFVVWDVASVERHRMTSCRNYSDCLSFVCRSQWPNFSCRSCPLFKPEAHVQFNFDSVIRLMIASVEED